jgi:hypothetical protein
MSLPPLSQQSPTAGELVARARPLRPLLAANASQGETERIWRDSATAAAHAVVSPQVGYEVYGKALLGVDDNITPLI